MKECERAVEALDGAGERRDLAFGKRVLSVCKRRGGHLRSAMVLKPASIDVRGGVGPNVSDGSERDTDAKEEMGSAAYRRNKAKNCQKIVSPRGGVGPPALQIAYSRRTQT